MGGINQGSPSPDGSLGGFSFNPFIIIFFFFKYVNKPGAVVLYRFWLIELMGLAFFFWMPWASPRRIAKPNMKRRRGADKDPQTEFHNNPQQPAYIYMTGIEIVTRLPFVYTRHTNIHSSSSYRYQAQRFSLLDTRNP
jgi:hypothetical protein